MDERDREEEGKDREGEGWKIGIKKVFFWNVLEFLFYHYGAYLYISKSESP
jgi:hypothetical protein